MKPISLKKVFIASLSAAIITGNLLADVTTIADLLAITTPTEGSHEYVLDQERGGHFVFRVAEDGNGNGGTKFEPNDATAGAWVRQYSGARNIRWFGASPSASASTNAAAINAAISSETGGEVYIPKGIYDTEGGHEIANVILVGEGMDSTTGSVLRLTPSNAYAIRVFGLSTKAGAGARNLGIVGTTAGQSGVILENCGHARFENVQVAMCYDGFYFRNSNSTWTESNTLIGVRVVGCGIGFRFGQLASNPGTSSFAYNTIIGTVSAMPTGGIGMEIETHATAPASLYGAFVRINMYMDSDASSIGLNVEGKLQHSSIFINGEKPGSGSHKALVVASTGTLREVVGSVVVENGMVDISNSATVANNNLFIASLAGPTYAWLTTLQGAGARLSSNLAIAGSTWTSVAPVTEYFDRPSNANNLNATSGVFTVPITGKYLCVGTACFTPASGDKMTGRFERSGSSARNFVVFQDTASSTNDRVMSGSVVIDCQKGDTLAFSAHSSNASGDTLRLSDSDGDKTHFSITFAGQ